MECSPAAAPSVLAKKGWSMCWTYYKLAVVRSGTTVIAAAAKKVFRISGARYKPGACCKLARIEPPDLIASPDLGCYPMHRCQNFQGRTLNMNTTHVESTC
jgi:hypothetical protein